MIQPLEFRKNANPLTIGVEMEIQVLKETLQLVPRAPEVLQYVGNDQITKEMFRSTLELITGVCTNVDQVKEDLLKILYTVREAGNSLGIVFAGTGTHPNADYNERILSASPRYHMLLDRNQWLIRRMAVYGLHVHIAVPDGDSCIRFMHFFLHLLPHLIALSASSPYWKGIDTGLAASRPTVYEAHPTSGLPYPVNNWEQFHALYQNLIRVGSIQNMKDIWWDIRPSPGFGTLEIRICDGPASMLELESIVAWIHLLAHWFYAEGKEIADIRPANWILRENKGRAIRYGTEAEIIDHITLNTCPVSDDIRAWIQKLTPYVERLGYQKYIACIEDLLTKGNSSARQRLIRKQSNDIRSVILHNIREFDKGEPIWK